MTKKSRETSNSKIILIESQGGDIAFDNSVIDKRIGNVHDETNDKKYNKDSAKRSIYFKVILGIVVSTFLGIATNILANYLQESFNLIKTSERILAVLIVFMISLVVTIILGIKSIKS